MLDYGSTYLTIRCTVVEFAAYLVLKVRFHVRRWFRSNDILQYIVDYSNIKYKILYSVIQYIINLIRIELN